MGIRHTLLLAALLCVQLFSASLYAAGNAKSYRAIYWTDLLPDEDLKALEAMPQIDHGAGDFGDEGFVEGQTPAATEQSRNEQLRSDWERALVSTKVRPEFDKVKVRLDGFIVPLEFNEHNVVTEFFLVPYFGACIHMPPPPPNQIIHVIYERGAKLEALYDPFTVSGTLHTERVQNETATAVYTMAAERVELYQE